MRTLSVILGIVMLFLLCSTVVCAAVQGQPAKKMSESEISFTDPSGYAPEELLVQFSSPQTDEKIAKKVEKFYGKETKKSHKIVLDYSGLGLSNTYLLKLSSGEDPKEVKEKYKQDSEVVFAEPNYVVTIDAIPNDPYFYRDWGLHNTGQRGYADADIDAPEAWELCTGSPEVIVAVIDTGVDYSHSDLAANIWTNSAEIPGNGVDDDHNGYIDDIRGWDFYNRDNNPMDDNGHGTHCAGTIGAVGNNGRGVPGVMWQTRIMPLKFMSSGGSGYTSDAVAAILYANMMGADVISNSWGGGGSSTLLKNAIDSSPAVVVCAAGNSAANIDATPFYPASYSSPQIIAVAASSAYDGLSSFSNYGSVSVDVAAPGEYIYSTYRGGSYAYMSGTSMATPHVAGLAGLVKAYSPGLTSSQIKAALLGNVDIKSSLNGKVLTSGRINAYRTLSSLGVVPVQVPVITSLSPSSAQADSPGFELIVTGSNFTQDSGVAWNGGQRFTTFVSSTQLRATILSGDIASTGTAAVTVTDPVGGTSNGMTFTIQPKPALVITSLSPSSAQAGGPGFVLTVTGAEFTSNSKILWDGAERTTTYGSDTQITAAITAADIASPGTATITVTDPDRTASNGLTFTIQPKPALVITSLSPSSAQAGGPGFVLTVTGAEFTSNSKVLWDGGQRSTTSVSSTQLQATILSGDIANSGTATITVTDPDRTASNGVTFTIQAPLPPPVPVITSLSPSSAQAGGPGFVLTVSGAEFTSNSKVLWDGGQRSTTSVSSTQLQATILSGDIANSGTATITVTDPERGTSNGMVFTIDGGLAAPVISTVSPKYLRRGGTRSLSIYGSNFAPGDQAELRRNGYTSIPCTGEVTSNSGKITCSVPIPSTARTGYWNLAVIHPNGQTGIKSSAVYIY
jgi:subtilisin family serine protease